MVGEINAKRTLCTAGNTIFDTDNAVLELLLRNPEVLVRVGQVLDLIVKLLFDLRKLLDAERIQIDYTSTYQHVIQQSTDTTAIV